jgi:hypothetical protein
MANNCETNPRVEYPKQPPKIMLASCRSKGGQGGARAASKAREARKGEDAILAELDKGPLGP